MVCDLSAWLKGLGQHPALGLAVTQAGTMLVELPWPGTFVLQEVLWVNRTGFTMRTWIGDTKKSKTSKPEE